VALGDVNKDGNIDLIFGRLMGTGLKILMGNGGGANGSDFKWTYLNSSWSPSATGDFWQMHLSDIDFDGDLDLLAAEGARNLNTGALRLYLGNGSDLPGLNFSWTEVTGKGLPLNNNIPFYGSNYLDFDNDGDKDVVGCSWGNGIMVFQNNMTLPDIPVAKAGSDITSYLGNTVTLDGTNSSDPQDCPGGDVAGTLLTYDWNITDQPIGSTLTDSNLSPSDGVAKPSFVPTHEGDYILSLRVRDSENYWGIIEDYVKITVIFGNTRPFADAGIDCEVEMGTLVALNGSGSFDNEDNFNLLTFDWNVSAGNPATVTLSDESAVNPTFTAPGSLGVYQFTLVVQDSLGLWSHEDEVNITIILPTNVKPIADAGLDFTSYSNVTVTLNGTGSYDLDGNILTWDWNCSSHPTLNIINENSSKPSFIPNSLGLYGFTLRILDDRGSWAEEDFVNVTIIEQNKRPKAFAGDDFSTNLNERTVLNGSASYDIDGEIFTWEWICTNDLDLILENGNSSKPSFTPDNIITYVFTLRVIDNFGLWSNIDTVNVTVIEQIINKIPRANAGENQTVYVNTTVFLNGIASTDEDGSIVTWSWSCTSHPSLSIINRNSATPSFYAAEIGSYTFSLEIKDDQDAWSDLDFITIFVLPEVINKTNETKNTPPTIQITYPKGGETLSNTTQITWIAYDEDGDTLEYTIVLLDGEGEFKRTLTEKLESATLHWAWDTKTEEDGTYMLLITVSDGIDTSTDDSGPIIINNTFLKGPTKKIEPSSSFNTGLFLGILLFIILIIIILVIFLFLKLSKSQDTPTYPPERSLPPSESSEENQIDDASDEQPIEHTEESESLDELPSESPNDLPEELPDQSPDQIKQSYDDPNLESTEQQYTNDNSSSESEEDGSDYK
jgi:hypothetical protein